MTAIEERELKAQLLYARFALHKVTQGGLAMPEWPGLAENDKDAWRAVADDVPIKLPAFARKKPKDDE